MRLTLNWFFCFFSPLEQFEISSYNTSLNYITTYPLELFENFYLISYNPETIYTFFDLILILIILKSIQLYIKKDGFIFLYIFILILLTCFNFYAFTDFIVYESFFSTFEVPFKNQDLLRAYSIITEDPWFYLYYIESPIKWFHFWPYYVETTQWYQQDFKVFFDFDEQTHPVSIFYKDHFISNLIDYKNFFISYAWFLGYLFYKGNPLNNSDNQIPLEISLNAINKIKEVSSKWNTQDIEWSLIFEDSNFNYLVNIFLPKYEIYLQGIKQYMLEEIYFKTFYENPELTNLGATWIMFLLIFVGIFLASHPELLQLNRFNENHLNLMFNREVKKIDMLVQANTCSTGQCGYIIPSFEPWQDYIMQNLSIRGTFLIYKELIITGIKVIPELMLITDIFLKQVSTVLGSIVMDYYSRKINFKVVDLFQQPFIDLDLLDWTNNNVNNFIYITTNTSFINIYSITFCFIFILLIIYLIFNKALSNNSNAIIPNIYQMFGESIYKISLNLFYSVLGKHLSHPEFFIKINTIFLFLIISNVQGMIPYMNTLTSALTNTFFIALALFINIIMTLLDKKGFNYFLNLFMPSGCPIFLVLLLIPIEVISYSFRVVSLSVRLFANMMAGHTLLKVIVGFSWIIVFIGNTSLINLFPIIILFILTLLEFGVALIQAYIFTILSCIYLRDIFQGH